jgi:hypothetical protein
VTRSLKADAGGSGSSATSGPTGASNAAAATAPVPVAAPAPTSDPVVDYGVPVVPTTGAGGYAAGGATGSGLGSSPDGTDPLTGGGLR